MILIYKNEYGACYKIFDAPNHRCSIQLIINAIGIFMSETDLFHLLNTIRETNKPCNCEDCKGKINDKIWCHNTLVDVCLKMDGQRLKQFEDLILRTKFLLEIDHTLKQHQIIN